MRESTTPTTETTTISFTTRRISVLFAFSSTLLLASTIIHPALAQNNAWKQTVDRALLTVNAQAPVSNSTHSGDTNNNAAVIAVSVSVAVVCAAVLFCCVAAIIGTVVVLLVARRKLRMKVAEQSGAVTATTKANKDEPELVDMTEVTKSEQHRREARIQKTDLQHEQHEIEDHSSDPSIEIHLENSQYIEIKNKDITVVEKLGTGAFGVVFRARFNDEDVALKKFDLDGMTEEQVRNIVGQFENEVRLLSVLRHPNVLGFRGALLEMPDIGIVTEYMSEGSMFDWLYKKKQKLSWKQKLKVLVDVAKGQHYLHKMKIIHRDLKSANVLLGTKTKDGADNVDREKDVRSLIFEAKVADFGLSKLRESSSGNVDSLNMHTKQVGTSLWMAPEVARGMQYGPKCDVFSFGMIMYECLCEKLPFWDYPKQQNIHMKVAFSPDFRPNISSIYKPEKYPTSIAAFCELMKKCWQHKIEDRPSFQEVLNEMNVIQQKLAEDEANRRSAAAASSSNPSGTTSRGGTKTSELGVHNASPKDRRHHHHHHHHGSPSKHQR